MQERRRQNWPFCAARPPVPHHQWATHSRRCYSWSWVYLRVHRLAGLHALAGQAGVLAAPSADPPGSPWWRAVNEGLLRDAWQAELLVSGRPGTVARPSVAYWIRFLRRPSAKVWYRAHNASIVAGYLDHRDLSRQEHLLERFLHGRRPHPGAVRPQPAHRPAPGPGPLRAGRPAARRSPLELNEPQLLEMLRDGRPVYAWPYDAGHVWTMAKAPRAIRTLRYLTRDPDQPEGAPSVVI